MAVVSFENRVNYFPIRVRRTVDDKFFESYREEIQQGKQIISCTDDAFIQEFDTALNLSKNLHLTQKHVCCECRRVYPSAHLLDIHLSEWHDSYFQVKAEKENSYSCLVETCLEKFATSKHRHRHLMKVHKFPPDFRFEHPPATRKISDKKTCQSTEIQMTEPESLSEMEIDIAPSSTSTAKVPSSICFGKGSNKGFHRQRRKNKSNN